MLRCLVSSVISLGLLIGTAQAATLGVPGPRSTVSGIGVISGWKCHAGELTIRFNGGKPIPLLYGAERTDVRDIGACAHADVGFLTIMNWGNLGDGTHTAVVYDDGREFARSTFTVVTTGERFLAGANGSCVAEDFPRPGDDSTFVWNEGTQHMELAQVREWYDEPDTADLPGNADLDFLLDRAVWTITVPDLLEWQVVSQQENPEWPPPRGQGGTRYVSAPADVSFLRYDHGKTSNKLYPFSEVPPIGVTLVGTIQGTRVHGHDRQGRAVLDAAAPRQVELATLPNGLPLQTREALGEVGDGYSLVMPMSGAATTATTHCYILVFDDFRRTNTGGLETQARFYITARTPYRSGASPLDPYGQRRCVPPLYPYGGGGQAVHSVTQPNAVTRLRID